jgi:Arc/MetJ-type ribon-helix-helix transcriptional regulator
MSPINVKFADAQLKRLDAGIAQGRAINRSDALRAALDHLLREWERQSWDEAWDRAIPDNDDEFADLAATRAAGWSDLDGDQ